jgi:hypothetical protein
MSMQQYMNGRLKFEFLQFAEEGSLDEQFLKLIMEDDEAFHSFHEMFNRLKGSINERIRIINEAIYYVRKKARFS